MSLLFFELNINAEFLNISYQNICMINTLETGQVDFVTFLVGTFKLD
jgi:hypothetical protein